MKNKKQTSLKFFRKSIASSDMICYIRGVGINEKMRPGIVNRPHGTGDWLLIYFNESVYIKSSEGIEKCPAGSWIIWDETDSHYYGDSEIEWEHSWIHFKGVSVAPIITDSGFETNRIMKLKQSCVLTEALLLIYKELTEQSNPDNLILQNLFHNLIRKMARETGKTGILQIPQRILKIKNMLESHPSERYSINILAKEAGMSVPHFCAEFKKHLGVPPVEYHIRTRLQQAKHLLHDVNLSVSEISDRLNYNNIYHFSKQFKKYLGISPSKLRHRLILKR